MEDVLEELKRAQSVFVEKTSEQARHMAWVIAVIYAKVNQLHTNVFIIISIQNVIKYNGGY